MGENLRQTPLGPVNIPAILAAFLIGLVIGVVVQPIFTSGSDTTSQASPRPEPTPGQDPTKTANAGPDADDSSNVAPVIRKAMKAGVEEAEAMGGHASIAVATPDNTFEHGSVGPFRLWSTAKVITSLILLEQVTPVPEGQPLPDQVEDALARSSNCAQRLMVIQIQDKLGFGKPTEAAFATKANQGGAQVDMRPLQTSAPEDSACDQYLTDHDVRDPQQETALFGTTEWNVEDAAELMSSVADGTFGVPGREIYKAMQIPKSTSPDPGAVDSVQTGPAWGAGNALAGLDMAYKSGWGGSEDGNYTVSQIVAARIGGEPVGIAAVFRPDEQPSNDSVGQGAEDDAIEAMLAAVRRALEEGSKG